MEYKNFKIEFIPGRGAMRAIKPKGKGSVPVKLRGMYTSELEACKAIDTYEKVKANDKTKSASGV